MPRSRLGLMPIDPATGRSCPRQIVEQTIRKEAAAKNRPADLINIALEKVVEAGLELPGFSTFDKLASRIRTEVRRQALVRQVTGGPGLGAGEPLVVAGPVHVQDLAEPLHLVGAPVVVNELEAADHQFVSPAKYLAALRRMSRSVASLRSLASSSATRASSCRTRSSGSPDGTACPRPGARLRSRCGDATAFAVPQYPLTQGRPVDRPGQRRCSCSRPGCGLVQGHSIGLELVRIVLHRHRRSSRFLRIKQIQYQRVHHSGGGSERPTELSAGAVRGSPRGSGR